MPLTTIRLLGPLDITIGDEPVSGFAYPKVRALLAFLAVESHRPHSREQLAALLWPNQPEQAARGSLSQALMILRKLLGDPAAAGPLLKVDPHRIQFDAGAAVTVDIAEFLALLRDADKHAHQSWRTCAQCAERLRRALDLYRGDFLADFDIPNSVLFQEWATFQREYLLQRALSALERLLERALWCGAYQEAIAYAQRLVALDPLLETNWRMLMRLLALNGEVMAALAQYKQLHSLLACELVAEPEEATTNLFNQIRRGDTAGLQPPTPLFIVPVAPTSLVGRATELLDICTRLQDMRGRALTITGPGGIGKTRLAIEVAQQLRYDYEDGVYVVELSPLRDAAFVADAIARVLGVKERPGQSMGATLCEHLRPKHLLLLLDNFEHVVEAGLLVAELLAASPALTVLTTSRTPLAIRCEQQFLLGPMADAEAVQLFIQRAQATGASPAINADSTLIYASICARLDGLPLAIELIAVRARSLAPPELLHQLERPLQTLAHGPRDLPARHQTLRNAIRWSYDLLNRAEQHAFAQLGVFVGGCTAEAAQAVLDDADSALALLESLHRASLLQQTTVADESRFQLLETIREFALEQLTAAGQAAAVRQRHAEYFVGLAQAMYIEQLRAEAPRWRARAAAEQGNVRAAFCWAVKSRAYEAMFHLALGVWRIHWMSGFLQEGLSQLETALAYQAHVPLELQANALRAAGVLAIGLNNYPRACQWLEASLEIGRRLDDPRLIQVAVGNLGYARFQQGQLRAAQGYLEESVAAAQQAQDPNVVRYSLLRLADLHLSQGCCEQAQAMIEETLRINRDCPDPENMAEALRVQAKIRIAQGDLLRARQLGEEALALHQSIGHQLGIGEDYILFGDIAHLSGDVAGALGYYRRCLSLWRDSEHAFHNALVLDSIAQLLAQLGEPARGVLLLGAAAAMRHQIGATLMPSRQTSHDQIISACRLALGETACAAAWATGHVLTPAQAIHLALEPSPLKGFHLTNAGGQDAIVWYDHACQDLISQRRNPCPPHRSMIPRPNS
ncbi:MAG: hypothetical protein IPP13_01660 [Kouleothrix sp.]|jgi:predicted ATPase/DNA-binding SARP family transcriptional activator|nr:hypothetical protein [Kouleothrix sp.]